MVRDETAKDEVSKNEVREDRFTMKVAILLAEYTTLRQEVIAARTNLGQGFGTFSTAMMANVAFGFSWSPNPVVPICIGLGLMLYLWALMIWNENNTASFTRRLRELEREINNVAGEPLMLWETIHGWGSMFRKTNPNFREECYAKPEAPLDSRLIEGLMKKAG